MRKALFTFAIVLLAVAAQAQIKVHDNGHVSLGCLTQDYGVQVQPNGFTYFRMQSDEEWGWATLSIASDSLQKHLIVSNLDCPTPGTHTFFVTGNGHVYKCGNWTRPSGNVFGRIDAANSVLDNITGVWYVPSNGKQDMMTGNGRCPGVIPQEVKEVLPEAVTADENGFLYVNYDALTVFLIEAVKEQRQEINLLRKTLEENGLLEPEKK